MDWIYNDGGRSKYFKGQAEDCVIRAIAIATQRDYKAAYNEAKGVLGYTPRNGVQNAHVRRLLAHFGGVWHPTMKIGTGCKVHLRKNELPAGRLVCNCSGHLVAVIDGVINDTHDPSRGGNRCVYGYWVF